MLRYHSTGPQDPHSTKGYSNAIDGVVSVEQRTPVTTHHAHPKFVTTAYYRANASNVSPCRCCKNPTGCSIRLGVATDPPDHSHKPSHHVTSAAPAYSRQTDSVQDAYPGHVTGL